MSLVRAFYHIVVRTKYSRPALLVEHKRDLYAYMAGIIKQRKCNPIIINGVDDHIHMLIELHPEQTLSGLMHDLKLGTSRFLKDRPGWFPCFEGWGSGYAAFTSSYSNRDKVIAYIKNQEMHHHNHTYEEEIQWFCRCNGVTYYPPAD